MRNILKNRGNIDWLQAAMPSSELVAKVKKYMEQLKREEKVGEVVDWFKTEVFRSRRRFPGWRRST